MTKWQKLKEPEYILYYYTKPFYLNAIFINLTLITVCPRSLYPFWTVDYCIKWFKTSSTYSIVKRQKCFHIFISCPFPVMDTWFKKLLIKNIMNNHQTLKELRKQLLLRGKAATASKSIKKSLIDMYSEVGLVFFSIIIFLYIWLYLYTIQTHTADHK